ncbi:MAG TPA: FAD-binding oxidoreductase [Hyphomicrobiaceae bacterium]|jgi:glycine/D-amino acid oxidase-like deaminating enzyme
MLKTMGATSPAHGAAVDSADVVIVGGGIVGSAVAYFLSCDSACEARRIVLIERDPSYAQASTARSAGGVRQQFSTPENIAMSQFTLSLIRTLTTTFSPDAEVGFREQGYLILAAQDSVKLLSENVALQQLHGASIALLDANELSLRFPWLATEGVRAGAFGMSGEGWFDPSSLASLLRNAARARGVVLLHDEVTRIDASNRVEAVQLASGPRLACEALVDAAGPWAGKLAAMAGLALPVEPRKRFVYVIDCRQAPETLRRAPLTVDPSGVWFRPEGRFFLCGKSPEEDEEPPADDLDQIDYAFFDSNVWPQLAARVPVFESVKAVNAWAGYYDFNTLDQNAIIGPHPDLTNFYFACGFSGHGAQQGAAAGRAIAELIVHDAFRTIDLSRLGYTRIAEGRPLPERNVI